VKTKITANLQDANVLDALDIICRIHNINYLVEFFPASKPMIRIYDQKDYLKALMYKGNAEVIKLKYTKAADMYKKLESTGAISKEATGYYQGIFYADEDSNSIIVVDKYRSTNLNKLRKVIEAFDQPTPQVLIEAKILTVALSDNAQYGVNWSAVWGKAGVKTKMPFQGDVKRQFSVKGKLKNTVVNASGIITALQEQGDVKVLSNPRITVLNNQTAKIIEGKNEPYNISIIVPSGGDSIIQNPHNYHGKYGF